MSTRFKQTLLFAILGTLVLSTSCAKETPAETTQSTTSTTTSTTTRMETTMPKKDLKNLPTQYDIDKLNYELVWSDEFDQDGLPNPENWSYETGGGGWGNNELEFYLASDAKDRENPNAWVEEGHLVIEARQEKQGARDYTSARMVTNGKHSWQYGKFEFRAKLPFGRGSWPAIWMMPETSKYGSWPKSGEIDIMEHVGYDQDNIVGTIHTESYNHGIGTQKGKTIHIEGVSEDYHVYTLEWLPDRIRWFVDGELYNEFDPSQYSDEITSDEWPFDQRFFLIFNIAVGGNWGGAKGVDETIWPQQMHIDYARVYQAPEIQALIPDKK